MADDPRKPQTLNPAKIKEHTIFLLYFLQGSGDSMVTIIAAVIVVILVVVAVIAVAVILGICCFRRYIAHAVVVHICTYV